MPKKLSNRLSACLNALFPLKRIADIGTDHAYLPCVGVTTGKLTSAIAIDVIDGPLMRARTTIQDYGLVEQIEVRKGSGFEPLAVGEVEGVVIAGMGGKLIGKLMVDSLDVAQSMKRLVLQPQSGEATLRRTLFDHDFTITNEQLLEEDGIIYTIITAIPGEANMTELDVTFGPLLRQNVKAKLFIQKWQQELTAINKVIRNIPEDNVRRTEFEQKRKLIEEVLTGATN